MKTRLHTFTIACVAALTVASLSAMEQPTAPPTHRFAGIIKERYLDGIVTCVKKISDKYLVVFQNSGTWLLFDLANRKYINQRWYNNDYGMSCLKNIFLYHDQDDQPLLIAYDNLKGLHVSRLNKAYECKTVLINHTFKVVEAMVGSKKTLVMINIDNNSAFPIDFTWAAFEKKDGPSYEDLFPIKPLNAFSLDDVIDEGLVVDQRTLHLNEQFQLSKEMFDIQSLTEAEKELSLFNPWNHQSIGTLPKIYCYDKTQDGTIFAGHADGSVSVWEPISHK